MVLPETFDLDVVCVSDVCEVFWEASLEYAPVSPERYEDILSPKDTLLIYHSSLK
jgi:hypothetical protein